MHKPTALIVKITVPAHLKTIIKYHPASAIYVTKDNEIEYTSTFQVKLLAEQVNGEQVILPDYKYSDIVDRILPDPRHENNLLTLVQHLIEIEWGYFQTYYVIDEKSKLYTNLHSHVVTQLKELKVLMTIIEQGKAKDLEGKLNLTELRKVGNKEKRLDVPGMQVEFANEEESIAVLKLLTNNRIEELSKPDYYFFAFNTDDFTEYSSEQIQQAIDRMKQPFKDYRAKWLFRKLVCQTILSFLKEEMTWNQGDAHITEDQGVIIHTLLAMFNLLDDDQEKKNITPRDKAKHIRGFFRTDLKDKDQQFVKFSSVRDYTEIKFDDNQWFKVTQ